MPKRSSKRLDANQIAARLVQDTIDKTEQAPPEKNPAAVALGRLGGAKGGPARAKALSAAKRKAIAKKAAKTRWAR